MGDSLDDMIGTEDTAFPYPDKPKEARKDEPPTSHYVPDWVVDNHSSEDEEWPTSFIVNRKDYERLMATAAAGIDAERLGVAMWGMDFTNAHKDVMAFAKKVADEYARVSKPETWEEYMSREGWKYMGSASDDA